MQWGDQLVGNLERAFQIEHLSCPEGMSYGAGHPISAADLLQSSISREDMEHYPDLFVDEWAAQHLIDQELGLESLIEFDFSESSDSLAMVQFVILDTEIGRSFLGRKVTGQPLEFIVAVDVSLIPTPERVFLEIIFFVMTAEEEVEIPIPARPFLKSLFPSTTGEAPCSIPIPARLFL